MYMSGWLFCHCENTVYVHSLSSILFQPFVYGEGGREKKREKEGKPEEWREGEQERRGKKREDAHQVLLKSVGRHGGPTMVT